MSISKISPKIISPIILNKLKSVPLATSNKITSNIIPISTQIKAKNTLKSLLDFDEIKPTNIKKRLVSCDKPKYLDENIRNYLLSLCSYSKYELEQLILLSYKYDINISKHTFWNIISKAIPLLNNPESTMQTRMFKVFNISNMYGLSLIEFILSVAVLSNKGINNNGLIITRATIFCDIVDLPKTNTINMMKIEKLFSDISISFNVQHNNGIMKVTNKELLQAYKNTLYQLSPDGIVERSIFEKTLSNHMAKDILLYPFGFQRDISVLWE
jgi:hypothetical protein